MDHDHLVELAKKARQNAYAPYSGFAVGAALLADDGKVYSGCNVENASYGLTICAERSAVAQMAASGARRIVALAVVAEGARPVSPCGACRQVLAEFAGADTPVILANTDGNTMETTIEQLLPYAFDKGDFHSYDG